MAALDGFYSPGYCIDSRCLTLKPRRPILPCASSTLTRCEPPIEATLPLSPMSGLNVLLKGYETNPMQGMKGAPRPERFTNDASRIQSGSDPLERGGPGNFRLSYSLRCTGAQKEN